MGKTNGFDAWKNRFAKAHPEGIRIDTRHDIQGKCATCGNTCSYDRESIKGDTYTLNGEKVVICGNCADDLAKSLKWRGRI
jgi:heterodisulfide reductase subunit A-like polyferredoxin